MTRSITGCIFPIHDYFFAKSIDKLRTGGIMAFITSSGTLDKRMTAPAKYIAERCDLIGAVRLPNNAFKGSGTKIMTDVIFLQSAIRCASRTSLGCTLQKMPTALP